MTQISIEEAVSRLKRELLIIPGIVGISHVGTTIIVYVERAEDISKVAPSYFGFPVIVRVTGPVRAL
jgi:hypothetical protein